MSFEIRLRSPQCSQIPTSSPPSAASWWKSGKAWYLRRVLTNKTWLPPDKLAGDLGSEKMCGTAKAVSLGNRPEIESYFTATAQRVQYQRTGGLAPNAAYFMAIRWAGVVRWLIVFCAMTFETSSFWGGGGGRCVGNRGAFCERDAGVWKR